jgi:hypothetical protein
MPERVSKTMAELFASALEEAPAEEDKAKP